MTETRWQIPLCWGWELWNQTAGDGGGGGGWLHVWVLGVGLCLSLGYRAEQRMESDPGVWLPHGAGKELSPSSCCCGVGGEGRGILPHLNLPQQRWICCLRLGASPVDSLMPGQDQAPLDQMSPDCG